MEKLSIFVAILNKIQFNPFQPTVAFYIETSHLSLRVNQMTGFYMKCNNGMG